VKKIKVLLLVFIFWADIFAQDLFKNKFNYSQIISVPDLSFIKQVYTGLDILEQMDESILENKKGVGFFSYLLVIIISLVALLVIGDTFKPYLLTIVPNLDFYLSSLYESLTDIYLFFKDLLK